MYGYYSKQADAKRLNGCWNPDLEASAATCGFQRGPNARKFSSNNFDYEDDAVRLSLEGYVLNDAQLLTQYEAPSLGAVIARAYVEDPASLKRLLQGAFVLALYDKKTDELLLMTDLLSKQELYFYHDQTELLFSTSFVQLAQALRRLGKSLTPDPMGVAMILKTNVFWEDNTYVDEIKFLRSYWYVTAGESIRLHRLTSPVVDAARTQQEAIQTADMLFSEGVKAQYEKNAREGFMQLASLSGGMDSRNVLVRAYQLGYHDDLTFTYAQSGSLDQTISQRIAGDYHAPHMYIALDNGDFLKERDFYVKGNEAMAMYPGSTGSLLMARALDCSKFGIVHTGLGGGEIMGDILPRWGDDPVKGKQYFDDLIVMLNCPSQAHVDALRSQFESYPYYNVFAGLNDMRTCPNFKRTNQPYFDVASPFLYEPFFEYMMTVPMELKKIRTLYYAWVDEKMKTPYPTTEASFPYRTGLMAERYLRAAVNRVRVRYSRKSKYFMNPHAYWYSTNPSLKEYFEATFRTDMARLSGLDPMVKKQLQDAFDLDSCGARVNVLSATWALTHALGD